MVSFRVNAVAHCPAIILGLKFPILGLASSISYRTPIVCDGFLCFALYPRRYLSVNSKKLSCMSNFSLVAVRGVGGWVAENREGEALVS